MSDLHKQLESLRSRRSDECVSDYEIDQLLVGDLIGAEASAVEARIDACAHCRQRLDAMRAAQRDFADRPIPIWLGRSKRRNLTGIGVTIAAVAAAALLFVRPGTEDLGVIRLKGGDRFGYIVVAPDGTVRGDQDSAEALPGDELQWRFRTTEDSYVAVLSKDPIGSVSVYYPDGQQAARTTGGREWTPPLAVRLDATVGDEKLFGLICSEPVELEPIRALLQAGSNDFPEACAVQEYTLAKREQP